MQPSEFWALHPEQFWWEYAAKLEDLEGSNPLTDWDLLYSLLEE